MRRVIGMDIHRTFGEVVFWEEGKLRHGGRVDMTRTALEGFGKSLLATDEVVIEATGNCMAVSRVLSPFVKRVVIANPLQVKAIAHAHVKTDKVDAGTLASLYAAGYLPEIWTPDAATERMRRLVARRYQVVRHRTRIKNEVHAILHAHLIPKCPHADLFNGRGRAWLNHVANAQRVERLDHAASPHAARQRHWWQVTVLGRMPVGAKLGHLSYYRAEAPVQAGRDLSVGDRCEMRGKHCPEARIEPLDDDILRPAGATDPVCELARQMIGHVFRCLSRSGAFRAHARKGRRG